jgi:hypothetical protein
MKYHKTLKELHDFTYRLTFGFDTNIAEPSNKQHTEYNVTFRSSCNKLVIAEFEEKIKSLGDYIADSELSNLEKFGSDYKKELLDILLSLDRLSYDLFDGIEYKGLLANKPKLDIFDNEAYKNGALEYGKITEVVNDKIEFYKLIQDVFTSLKERLVNEILSTDVQPPKTVKLKLNTPRPAVLAGLINELEEKRWISLPITNGEVSYAKSAKLIAQIFEFEGEESTLLNGLKDKERLSDILRAKIHLSDIEEF